MKILLYLFLVIAAYANYTDPRLSQLSARSKDAPNRIIIFTPADFKQYVMRYPRPYDVVIFFSMKDSELGKELFVEYQYLTKLYEMGGAIDSQKNPTFFVRMDFVRQDATIQIFRMFQFESVPNMVVSKPEMAVVGVSERSNYLKEYTWEISYKDNHVTTHKMLQFVNKRTHKDITFRYTDQTIQLYLQYFLAAAVAGVLLYLLFKKIWNHWIFWLIASLMIYTTCVSGIVYCLIHDVPLIGQTNKIFTGGQRQQSGLEGWFISAIITTIGLMFMFIGISGEKCSKGYSSLVGVIGLVVISIGVLYLERVYRTKGWYGPSFYPPEGYLRGPLSVDQGNNI